MGAQENNKRMLIRFVESCLYKSPRYVLNQIKECNGSSAIGGGYVTYALLQIENVWEFTRTVHFTNKLNITNEAYVSM